MQRFAAIIISMMVGLSAMSAGAMSFNLDSIAAKDRKSVV